MEHHTDPVRNGSPAPSRPGVGSPEVGTPDGTAVIDVLGDAARALHSATDLHGLLEWAAVAASRLAGTPDVAVCLRARDASAVWTSPPDAGRRFDRLGDPRSHPLLHEVLTDNRPLVLDHASAPAGAAASLLRFLDVESLLVLPVTSSDDEVEGLVLLAGDAAPGDEVSAAIAALADHLGVALENMAARAAMAEQRARGEEVVHRLQEAVRPPAPVVEHTELGVRYVAADPSAPTGGDLYDWITLPDGSLHFVVVDVMGKGVQATKHALAVTHALRLLVLDGCPMDAIVARADRLVTAQNPDLVATLIVGRYWSHDGRMLLAGAGHPPALLVADGRVREVNVPGIPIGWPGAASHSLVELHLDRQDTLILYTDGLIEATKDILEGLQRLCAAAVATAGYPATSMARALVDRQLEDATRRDDSLALIVRRRLPPPVNGVRSLPPLVHRFSPSTAAVPLARHLLGDWLRQLPVDDDAIDGLLLVATELAGNAVRHSEAGPGGICLRAAVDGSAVVLEVSDDGGAPVAISDDDPQALPDADEERGRGLFLVRELADELRTSTAQGITTVTAIRRDVIAAHDEHRADSVR